MGYILPITHYTYQQYQVRQIDKNNRPYYVDKLHPSIFKKDYVKEHNSHPLNYRVKQRKRNGTFIETSDRGRKGQYINETK